MPSNPYRARGGSSGPFGRIPQGVKILLIALGVLSIGTSALRLWSPELGERVKEQLWFQPSAVLSGKVWQLATYTLFTWDPVSLIISALMLWMFAGTLERRWGTRRFLTFYFSSVALAGVLTTVLSLAVPPLQTFHNAGSWTAIEALCAAFALGFPNEQILLMFVLPIQARYLIHISVGITVLYALMDGQVLPAVTPMFGLVAGAALMSRAARPRQFMLRLRVWWIDRRLRARKMRVIRGLPDDDDLPQRRSGSRGSDGFLH